MNGLLNSLLRPQAVIKPTAEAATRATLDSATVLGLTMDAAGQFAGQYLQSAAIAVVNEWAATNDLEEGETYSDRLLGMLASIGDTDNDGELSEDEAEYLNDALTYTAEYLIGLGVSEEDAQNLLDDPQVADRVRELVATNLPDGEDAEDDVLNSLVFTPEDQEPVMDAAYKKVVAIRAGKKVRINKRVSGTVHRTARQKLATKKAMRKAFSPKAMMKRQKSMKLRARMGL